MSFITILNQKINTNALLPIRTRLTKITKMQAKIILFAEKKVEATIKENTGEIEPSSIYISDVGQFGILTVIFLM